MIDKPNKSEISKSDKLFIQMIDIFFDSIQKKLDKTPDNYLIKAKLFLFSCSIMDNLLSKRFLGKSVDINSEMSNFKKEVNRNFQDLGLIIEVDSEVLKGLIFFPDLLQFLDSQTSVSRFLDYSKRSILIRLLWSIKFFI